MKHTRLLFVWIALTGILTRSAMGHQAVPPKQDPEPAPTERPVGPPMASLGVTVVDEDGNPLPQVYVSVSTTETELRVLGTLGMDAKESLAGKTDEEGRRVLSFLAGKERTVYVGAFAGTSREKVEVTALGTDEVREIRVPVQTRPDSTFRGQLLDAGTPSTDVAALGDRRALLLVNGIPATPNMLEHHSQLDRERWMRPELDDRFEEYDPEAHRAELRGRVIRPEAVPRLGAPPRTDSHAAPSDPGGRSEPGLAVLGTVTEADGTVAVDQEVALSAEDRGWRGLFYPKDEYVATTRTDAGGRYRFENVAPGPWTVGLRQAWRPGRPDSEAIAPVAHGITVPDAGGPVTVDLTVCRGHFLEGIVVTPEGTETEASIWALGEDARMHGMTDRNGHFRLGPLPSGEYRIQSRPRFGSLIARSPWHSASTEQGGHVLSLQKGTRLALRAIDLDTREPLPCKFILTGGEGLLRTSFSIPKSRVCTFGAIEPGIYRATAITVDGRVGHSQPLIVEEGEAPAPLEIEVRTGGHLTVGYSGHAPTQFLRILQGESLYGFDVLADGTAHRFTVPVGRIAVRLGQHVRWLEVNEGDELEIDFELPSGG